MSTLNGSEAGPRCGAAEVLYMCMALAYCVCMRHAIHCEPYHTSVCCTKAPSLLTVFCILLMSFAVLPACH